MTITLRPPKAPPPPRNAQTKVGALPAFVRAQSVNMSRGVSALRPFTDDEFGTSRAAPTRSHIGAVNDLMTPVREVLRRNTSELAKLSRAGTDDRTIGMLLATKGRSENQLKAAEAIWDWYFEMFSQRSTRFGPWLYGCDQIALDCYQVVYTGLGMARSIPSPPPFSYLETGFTPSTFRRGVPLSRLGKRGNPFPVVQIPLHRMVNPWTLGAINHEVAHNIQSDLDMWGVVPKRISQRLTQAGLPPDVVRTWSRWHKEIWADLAGLLLGGPAIATSLMDVVSKPRSSVARYNDLGVHPTPYLRPFISTELLRRMGFENEAEVAERTWRRLYPRPAGDIPRPLMRSARKASALVVDVICYQPYKQLGNKTLAAVIPFPRTRLAMISEAAQRLAAGVDPGIIPPRFLIGATRVALDRQLARPGRITHNFYEALAGRSA